jgi:hypothetical protein
MNFYNWIKALLSMPTPLQVAARSLATAELELLRSETGVEFASSMVAFNKAQIKRLRAYIAAKTVEVSE